MNKRLATAAVVALALASAACGSDDGGSSGASAAKTVEIEMVDVAYEPETITVPRGEEVQFVFVNKGKTRREAYVGTTDEQLSHGMEMREKGDGAGHDAHGGGDDDAKVSVEPGKRGDLTTRFDEAGTYEIGCHEPGHYEAGMKLTVEVT